MSHPLGEADVAFEVTRFHVGGNVQVDDTGSRVVNQMYVERIHQTSASPHPRIVMVHGTDQTGLCFLQTPDGRPGWAYDFARLGWDVYVVDQVARGRSAYDPAVHGALSRMDVEELKALFIHAEVHGRFAHAVDHWRWPAAQAISGETSFDAFAASQVASISNLALAEELNTVALSALFHHIGSAVLLTHSQASAFGFQLCDREPGLVKAHVTVEPNGPPFYDVIHVGEPKWHETNRTPSRPWGITRRPLRYDPSPQTPDDLNPVHVMATEMNMPPGWLPEPIRALPHLARTPHTVVTGAASYRTLLDYWTVTFLIEAGVPTTHFKLADHNVHGNGHMMMLEDNSSDIALQLAELLSF